MRSLRSRTMPWIVFVAVSSLGLSLWGTIERARHDRLSLETEVVADQVHRRLEAWIEARMAFLGNLADNWSPRYASDPAAFRRDASLVCERLPGFQAINWVNAHGIIEIVVPERDNRAALGKNLHEHPHAAVRLAIERAARERRVTRTTSVVEFYQGGRGFAVYWPVVSGDGELVGFVNGVFRVNNLVDRCLAEAALRERFRFLINDAGWQPAYGDSTVDEGAWPYEASATINVVDQPWQLRIAPSESFLAAGRTAAHWVLLAAILGVSLAIAFLLDAMLVRQVELRASERKVRLLLESTAEGIYGVDTDGICTFCNPACLEILGYEKPEDLLDKKIHGLIHHARHDGSEHPEEACRVYQAFRDGEGVHMDGEPLWRRDGTVFSAEVRSYPIRHRGEIKGAVVTFTDITDRREAEEERRRMTAIIEATPDLVSISDARGRLLYLNQRGRDLLDIPAEDPLGGSILDFHVESERDRVETEALAAASRDGVWRGEFLLKSRSGSVIPTSAVVIAHVLDGEVAWYSAIYRDISDDKRAEKERRVLEAQFYESERMRSLGLLGGGIAHDFNNLLVGIMGNANLAAEDLPEDSPVRESIRAIEVSANRAAALTSQLLAYSGRGRFDIKRIDLCELVEEMDDLLGVSIHKRITLRRDCDTTVSPIKADATQIRQVVMNLLTNAADAIGDRSGEIVVKVTTYNGNPADLAGRSFGPGCSPGRYSCLEIRDDGCGMDDMTVARMFDPFFTTKFTGRGLGLAAVLGIIRGHGGALNVSSRKGIGTTFTVLFPASEGGVESLSKPVERVGPAVPLIRDSGLVLIVDDEQAVRGFSRTVLERNGLDVLTARDGKEGVETFARHHRELIVVLLDLTMPGMSGDEAFEAMNRIDADVPVILTSGYDAEQTADRYAGVGFAAFLKKPFSPADLLGLIRQSSRQTG